MWWEGLVAFGETCLGVRWKGPIQGMRTQRSGTAKGNQPMDCERSVVYDSIWFNFMLWVNQKAVMNSHPTSSWTRNPAPFARKHRHNIPMRKQKFEASLAQQDDWWFLSQSCTLNEKASDILRHRWQFNACPSRNSRPRYIYIYKL